MTADRGAEVGRCRVFHLWTKWGTVQRGNRLIDGRRMGDLLYQVRECERCGKTQLREVAS